MNNKLKNLKDEYKQMLESYNTLNQKTKSQNTEIITLNQQCKLIRENIEAKKKSQNKGESCDINEINDAIKEMNMEINEKKVTAKNQVKNYQNEIKVQEKKINQLNKDIKNK